MSGFGSASRFWCTKVPGAVRRRVVSQLGSRAAGWSTSTNQEYAAEALNAPGREIIGKPYEGKPHVRFDEAGDGNPDSPNGAIP